MVVLLVVKRDEENESNARVADAILVCVRVCASVLLFGLSDSVMTFSQKYD